MRKLLLTTLAFISFQTPVFAQVNIGQKEIHRMGEIRGMVYCAALQNGARTPEQIGKMSTYMKDPDIDRSYRLYDRLSSAQKEIYLDGMYEIVENHCYMLFKEYKNNL